jgi:hypothetical protein
MARANRTKAIPIDQQEPDITSKGKTGQNRAKQGKQNKESEGLKNKM